LLADEGFSSKADKYQKSTSVGMGFVANHVWFAESRCGTGTPTAAQMPEDGTAGELAVIIDCIWNDENAWHLQV
jgi:hypothetical protein